MTSNIMMPFNRGRAATEVHVREVLHPLVAVMSQQRARFSFSPTLRGWCYVLEGLGLCTKGDFDAVMERITRCRKLGLLPLDITAADDTRASQGGGAWCHDGTPAQFLADQLRQLSSGFRACDTRDVYRYSVEVVVEKLDLVGLFEDVLLEYGVPVTCSRGWSDLHMRAGILQRAAISPLPTVMIMFGDHDPGGLSISEAFRSNLQEVVVAAGVNPSVMSTIDIVRAGLNAEDIDRLGLTWIDGLETSGGGDLSHPSHRQHRNADVQDYLRKYGPRKCEANALIARPDDAAELLRSVLSEYISDDEVAEVQRLNDEADEKVGALVDKAVEFVNSLEQRA